MDVWMQTYTLIIPELVWVEINGLSLDERVIIVPGLDDGVE